MAKVSGPLMSMGASGKFGGAMVFASRIGTPVVRALVTPANPMSLGQVTARNIVRVCGAAQKFARLCVLKGAGRLVTDLVALKAITPQGQTWNGYLVKLMTGTNATNYTTASGLWTALAPAEKTAWDSAAGALTPAILAVAQMGAGNVPAADMSAGQVFFHYQYGLFVGGIAAVPGAVPPTYA